MVDEKAKQRSVAVSDTDSKGSKYPIFKDPGSKNHTRNGIWDQRP